MSLEPELQARLVRLIESAEEYLPKTRGDIHWSDTWVANWVGNDAGYSPLSGLLSGGYLATAKQALSTKTQSMQKQSPGSISVHLSDLIGIENQKNKVVQNTKQLLAGFPANNVLLWGARGTGKSSLIHALLHDFADQGLRVVQLDKQQLKYLPIIVDQLLSSSDNEQAYKFILYCDDLSFEEGEADYKALKSVLDGALFNMPDNVVIYATSNRRHLVPEYHSDNAVSKMQDDQIHHGDVVEEKISLSDRFGLWISFYPMQQTQYLEISEHWIKTVGKHYGIALVFDEDCRRECLKWALARGTRSGRTAYQFARHWVGLRLSEV